MKSVWIALCTLLAAPAPCRAQEGPPDDAAHLLDGLKRRTIARILQHGPLESLPVDPTNRHATSDAAARLGQALFFDTRLSADGARSCATCHVPAQAFTDGLALRAGPLRHNTPTLLGAAAQRWMFWDGRADSPWSQVFGPLEAREELGVGRAGLARLLAEDPALRAQYRAAFGADPAWAEGGLESVRGLEVERTAVNGAKAIAAYEARLVPGESDFDRFARALRDGDRAAQERYPAAALRGLVLFVDKASCRTCHVGPLFTDGEFHSIGVPPLSGGKPTDPRRLKGIEIVRADRYNAAGEFSDDREGERARELAQLADGPHLWGAVRTPSLRNVARTAPYMHEGQKRTLADVLRYYSTLEGAIPAGHHGESVLLPLQLNEFELADLEAFLVTLTGDPLPAELTRPPSLTTPEHEPAPK